MSRSAMLHKWRQLPWRARLLLVQMTLLLAMIRLALKLWPLPKVQALLQRTAVSFASATPVDAVYLGRVGWSATAVSRRLLRDRPCLTQALAVHWLLQRRGYPAELCIGVVKEADGRLYAHAWVESNGAVVVGGAEAELRRYVRLRVAERSEVTEKQENQALL